MLIRWLYKDMNVYDRERIIKFLLCTVAGFGFSLLIDDQFAPTTAVTANLILYIDRGFLGSIRYGWKRLEVQLIQGGICAGVLLLFQKVLQVQMHETLQIIIACMIAILIGLPLHYKHQIAPYTTTLANATFLMAAGACRNMMFYPRRALHCLVGALIGLFINWILMPQHDRYLESIDEIRVCASYLFDRIRAHAAQTGGPEIRITDKTFREKKELLDKNVSVILADNGKNPAAKKVAPELIGELKRTAKTVGELERILADVQALEQKDHAVFVESFIEALNALERNLDSRLDALARYEDRAPEVEKVQIETSTDAHLLLISGLVRLRQYIGTADAVKA